MFDNVHLDDLDDGIGQLHGVVCAGRRQLLSMIAAFDRRDGWRSAGQTSTESYLVARLGVSRRTAHRLVRVARALESLPVVAAAYERGELCDEAVEHAVDLATPDTDAAVAAMAVGATVAELERLALEARRVARQEAEARHHRRTWRVRHDVAAGVARITVVLPDVDAARAEQGVHRVAKQLVEVDEHGLHVPFDQRCADAFVELCGARIADDHDPDRATVVVHVDASRGVASLDDGTVLGDDTARRICCDARIQAMLHGPDRRLLAVSVVEHAIPPALRRKVLHRDRHCRFPGCDRRLFAHVHHVVHHADGGPTVDANLAVLCPFHHRLVHEGGWSLTGDPNGTLAFTSPYGRVLATGPPPLRAEVRERCTRLFPVAA